MTISPYLAVRAIGNAGQVQPGRVVNGNNFIPLGNSFNGTVSGSGTSGDPAGLGLENQSFAVNYGNDESRIVQWGDDIFLWQQNRIRQYNPVTEDWDIVHTVSDQEDAQNWNYHTGLHFMHAVDGSPLLIGLAGRQSTTGVIRVRYDGSTWSSAAVTSLFNMDTSRRGIAVFQNQLYRSNGATIVRYDPIADLIITQTASTGTLSGEYTDMIVFDNRLWHVNQGNTGDIHELVGGSWVNVSNFLPSNLDNTPSFFEKDGKLYLLSATDTGSFDGWRLHRFNDPIYSGVANITATVLPDEIRDEGPGNPPSNYHVNARSHVVVDQDSDPENPRIIILIGTAAGAFNTVTAWEFIDDTQQLVKFPGGNLTGEMLFPHNNWGSGSYHWTKNELNVHIVGTRAVQSGEEIEFIAYGDPGSSDKKVRIYFSNEQENANSPATLLSAGPVTTGVSIGTDTRGNFVDGVDADGSTVYTVIRDIDADLALVGQRQVLMPYIERP
jgi:hypothetical protein